MAGAEPELLPTIPGFRLEREIGRGATGRVYLAVQEALARPVAVKVITTLGEKGRRRALRLFREARLAGALDHPAIVKGIDAGAGEGLCWFAMEYIEGRSLDRIVAEDGPLPLARVLQIAGEILSALDHAHRRGVVHRDIKPANVLIGTDGRSRLLDLGLARRETDPRLTDDTGSLGTPLYMSPEQARSPALVDARSDLFSLAATAYHALCGVAPFQGATVTQVLTRLLYDDPKPPSSLVEDLPPAVDLVLLKALSKDREHRYPDASHFLRDVDALQTGRAPDARRVPEPHVRSPRRRATVIVAGAAVLFVAAGWLVLRGRSVSEDARADPDLAAVARSADDPTTELEVIRSGKSEEQPLGSLAAARRAREILRLLGSRADGRTREAVEAVDRAFLSAVDAEIRRGTEKAAAGLANHDLAVCDALVEQGFEAGIEAKLGRAGEVDPRLGEDVHQRAALAREALARQKAAWHQAARDRVVQGLNDFRAERRGAASDRPTLERQIEDLIARTGPWTALDAATRTEVADLKQAAVEELLRLPGDRWDASLQRVAALRAAGNYRDALVELETALARDGIAVPAAPAEAARRRQEILTAMAEEVRRIEGLKNVVRRATPDGLTAEEQRARLLELRAAVDAAAPRVDQIEGASEPWTQLLDLVTVVAAAVELRPAALRAASLLGGPEGPVIEPVVRGEARRISPRRLLGTTPDGQIRTARASDGFPFAYPLSTLGVSTLLGILDLAKVPADPRAAALLCYLEGEDLEAQVRAGQLPAGWFPPFLQALAASGVEARARRYNTADEREASTDLARVRLLLGEGRPDDARELLARIASRAPKKPVADSSFWAEFRKSRGELLKELDRADVFGEWVLLKPWFHRADPEAGLLVIRLPLSEGRGAEAFQCPEGCQLGTEGLELRPAPGAALVPPPGHPALHLPLPSGLKGDLELQLEVVYPGAEAVAFLAVSCQDLCFLGLGTLEDRQPFQDQPLHGLERSLRTQRRVSRGALWTGGVKDYVGPIGATTLPFDLTPGEPTLVRLTIKDSGRAVEIEVGKQRYPLARSTGPRLVGDGLRISGFPALRLRLVQLIVRLAPGGSDR